MKSLCIILVMFVAKSIISPNYDGSLGSEETIKLKKELREFLQMHPQFKALEGSKEFAKIFEKAFICVEHYQKVRREPSNGEENIDAACAIEIESCLELRNKELEQLLSEKKKLLAQIETEIKQENIQFNQAQQELEKEKEELLEKIKKLEISLKKKKIKESKGSFLNTMNRFKEEGEELSREIKDQMKKMRKIISKKEEENEMEKVLEREYEEYKEFVKEEINKYKISKNKALKLVIETEKPSNEEEKEKEKKENLLLLLSDENIHVLTLEIEISKSIGHLKNELLSGEDKEKKIKDLKEKLGEEFDLMYKILYKLPKLREKEEKFTENECLEIRKFIESLKPSSDNQNAFFDLYATNSLKEQMKEEKPGLWIQKEYLRIFENKCLINCELVMFNRKLNARLFETDNFEKVTFSKKKKYILPFQFEHENGFLWYRFEENRMRVKKISSDMLPLERDLIESTLNYLKSQTEEALNAENCLEVNNLYERFHITLQYSKMNENDIKLFNNGFEEMIKKCEPILKKKINLLKLPPLKVECIVRYDETTETLLGHVKDKSEEMPISIYQREKGNCVMFLFKNKVYLKQSVEGYWEQCAEIDPKIAVRVKNSLKETSISISLKIKNAIQQFKNPKQIEEECSKLKIYLYNIQRRFELESNNEQNEVSIFRSQFNLLYEIYERECKKPLQKLKKYELISSIEQKLVQISKEVNKTIREKQYKIMARMTKLQNSFSPLHIIKPKDEKISYVVKYSKVFCLFDNKIMAISDIDSKIRLQLEIDFGKTIESMINSIHKKLLSLLKIPESTENTIMLSNEMCIDYSDLIESLSENQELMTKSENKIKYLNLVGLLERYCGSHLLKSFIKLNKEQKESLNDKFLQENFAEKFKKPHKKTAIDEFTVEITKLQQKIFVALTSHETRKEKILFEIDERADNLKELQEHYVKIVNSHESEKKEIENTIKNIREENIAEIKELHIKLKEEPFEKQEEEKKKLLQIIDHHLKRIEKHKRTVAEKLLEMKQINDKLFGQIQKETEIIKQLYTTEKNIQEKEKQELYQLNKEKTKLEKIFEREIKAKQKIEENEKIKEELKKNTQRHSELIAELERAERAKNEMNKYNKLYEYYSDEKNKISCIGTTRKNELLKKMMKCYTKSKAEKKEKTVTKSTCTEILVILKEFKESELTLYSREENINFFQLAELYYSECYAEYSTLPIIYAYK